MSEVAQYEPAQFELALPYLRLKENSKYATLELMLRHMDINWNPNRLPFEDMIVFAQAKGLNVHYLAAAHPQLTYALVIKHNILCTSALLKRFRFLPHPMLEALPGFTREAYVRASIAPPEEILANLDEPWDWIYIAVYRGMCVREFFIHHPRSNAFTMQLYSKGLISAQDVLEHSDYLPTSLGYRSGYLLLDSRTTEDIKASNIDSCTVGIRAEDLSAKMDLNKLMRFVRNGEEMAVYERFPNYPCKRVHLINARPATFTTHRELNGDEWEHLTMRARQVVATMYPESYAKWWMRCNEDLLYAIAYGHYSPFGGCCFTAEPLLPYAKIVELRVRVNVGLA